MTIIINIPRITAPGPDRSRISSTVCMDGTNRELWFEVNGAYGACLADDTLDAFAVALLMPAIMRGCDIHVNGPMSARLYYNISNYLIPILSDYLEKPRATKIFAKKLVTAPVQRGSGVMSGFSGGVDSFCNYYDHSGGRAQAEFDLTHFVLNNVGSHGQQAAEADRAIFNKRHGRLRRFAESENRMLSGVDSNLDEVMAMSFELTHTIRNASVALLLQKGIGKFMYASGVTLSETTLKPTSNLANLEPVILPLFGTERLDCIASGGQHTRVEKTRRMIEIPASREYLDVCIRPHNAPEGYSNCALCWKCIRTLMTIHIYGRMDEYKKVFRIDDFEMFKNLYLIEIMSSSRSYSREIRQLIAEKGFHVPWPVRFAAAFMPGRYGHYISMWLIPRLAGRKSLTKFLNACLAYDFATERGAFKNG